MVRGEMGREGESEMARHSREREREGDRQMEGETETVKEHLLKH